VLKTGEVQEGQARQARRHRPHAPDPHGHGDSQGNDPARTGIRRPPPGAAADARPSFFGDVAFVCQVGFITCRARIFHHRKQLGI